MYKDQTVVVSLEIDKCFQFVSCNVFACACDYLDRTSQNHNRGYFASVKWKKSYFQCQNAAFELEDCPIDDAVFSIVFDS